MHLVEIDPGRRTRGIVRNGRLEPREPLLQRLALKAPARWAAAYHLAAFCMWL